VAVAAAASNLEASGSARLAELRRLITRHAGRGETTAIDGVLVSAATVAGEPAASSSGTVMALIVQGTKRLACGGRVHEYGAGQYLVASVDLPITGHYSQASLARPALGFGLVLRPTRIASLLLDAGASKVSAPARVVPPALGVADAPEELLDAAIRMLRLLDDPADRAILAPMIEREILWRLLRGPLGETVRQAGIADSSLTSIGRAVRWITEHYAEPFRVADLARRCSMSTSAFHRNFQAVTASSPLRFQKQIRLQKARLMLMADTDVATAGYRVGYDNTSQFSREYRRQFGLPPGQDARRLRAGRAPAAA
jgi:AraC-like DNA-binding protein